MSGNFKYLFLIGHDTKYLENGLYSQLTYTHSGAPPPRVFIPITRTSHFLNITYLTIV